MDYHTGDGEAALCEAGWYSGNRAIQTQAVGHKLPNRHGLYDMHGNVSEWCRDTFDADAYKRRVHGVIDPGAGTVNLRDDAYRVIRGGSWGDRAASCRAAFRLRGFPGLRFMSLGFRVGLFPVQSCQQQQP